MGLGLGGGVGGQVHPAGGDGTAGQFTVKGGGGGAQGVGDLADGKVLRRQAFDLLAGGVIKLLVHGKTPHCHVGEWRGMHITKR